MLQIMITGFIDTVPQWFRKGGKTILIMILCIIFAIIGLVICARVCTIQGILELLGIIRQLWLIP